MGFGKHEKPDEENPQSEEEQDPETKRLNQPPADDIELKTITKRNYDTGLPQVIEGVNKPFFKTHHLKYALFTFNGILAIFGLIVMIMAVWVRVDPEFWEYKRNINIDNFYAVCHMLIVAGLILFFVAFIGCIGAFTENQLFLMSYFVIFVLIFILQLAAVIMVYIAPYNRKMKDALTTQVQNQVNNRDIDDTSRLIIDLMQQNLKCCGSKSQKDYTTDLPHSCRSPDTGSVHNDGCADMLLKYLKAKAGVIAGITIPVLLFQLLALLATLALVHNIRNESKYSM